MKKILFGLALSTGLLLALPVLGATTPTQNQPTSGTAVNQNQPADGNYWQVGLPCPMMQGGSAGIYSSQYPCGGNVNYFHPRMMAYGYGHEAAWFGLMFVLTVMLVWVVLLLLIAYLWHLVFHHKHN